MDDRHAQTHRPASVVSTRSSVTGNYKKKLALDLRFEAAGALEYVVPPLPKEPALSEAERAQRKVLSQSDVDISARSVTLSRGGVAAGLGGGVHGPHDTSEKVPVLLGSARRIQGFDTFANVRSPHALLSEQVVPQTARGGELDGSASSRGFRVDLKDTSRGIKIAGSLHENEAQNGRGFARGIITSQPMEVTVNTETGEILEVTPASPEAISRAKTKPDVSHFPRSGLINHGERYRRDEETKLGVPRPAWVSNTNRNQIEADLETGRVAIDNYLGLRKRFGEKEETITTPATKIVPAVVTEPKYKRFIVRAREMPLVENSGDINSRVLGDAVSGPQGHISSVAMLDHELQTDGSSTGAGAAAGAAEAVGLGDHVVKSALQSLSNRFDSHSSSSSAASLGGTVRSLTDTANGDGDGGDGPSASSLAALHAAFPYAMAKVQPVLETVAFQRHNRVLNTTAALHETLEQTATMGSAGLLTGRSKGGGPTVKAASAVSTIVLTDNSGRPIDGKRAAEILQTEPRPPLLTAASHRALPPSLAVSRVQGGPSTARSLEDAHGMQPPSSSLLSSSLLSGGMGGGSEEQIRQEEALEKLTARVMDAIASYRLDKKAATGSSQQQGATGRSTSRSRGGGFGFDASLSSYGEGPSASASSSAMINGVAVPPLNLTGGLGQGTIGFAGSKSQANGGASGVSTVTKVGSQGLRNAAARVFPSPFSHKAASSGSTSARLRRRELQHPSMQRGESPVPGVETARSWKQYEQRSLCADPSQLELGFIMVGQTYALTFDLQNRSPQSRRFRLERVGLFDRPELARGTLLCRIKALPLPAGLSTTSTVYLTMMEQGFVEGQIVFGVDDGGKVEISVRGVAVAEERFNAMRDSVITTGTFDSLNHFIRDQTAHIQQSAAMMTMQRAATPSSSSSSRATTASNPHRRTHSNSSSASNNNGGAGGVDTSFGSSGSSAPGSPERRGDDNADASGIPDDNGSSASGTSSTSSSPGGRVPPLNIAAAGSSASALGSAASVNSSTLRGANTLRTIDSTGNNAVSAVKLAGLQRTPNDVLARVQAFIRDVETAKRTELEVASLHGALAGEEEDEEDVATGLKGSAGAGSDGNEALRATARLNPSGKLSAAELMLAQRRKSSKKGRFVMDREAVRNFIIPFGGTSPSAVPIVLRKVDVSYEEPTLFTAFHPQQ